MNGDALLNSAVVSPQRDGSTPVFVFTGADPSAVGLDLPPGSIARFGAAWYWKVNTGATDWITTPFNTGGGGGGATVAAWTLGTTTPRYFAVAPDGDDSAAGFSDLSATLAWAVRKRTWAGFLAIFPQVGAGRSAVVLTGAGTYGEDLVITKSVGYETIHVVATTDGSDNAADRILSGAVVATAGPGLAGVWTCVAGGSTTDVKVAAGLPAETGATGPTLFRVRFAANTTTAALRSICVAINRNTATDITPSDTLPAAPVAGDTFFIERSGAVFLTVKILNACNTLAMRGIATSGITAPWSTQAFSIVLKTFCESRGDGSVNESGMNAYAPTQSYSSIAPTVATSTLGVGFRVQGQWSVSAVRGFSGNNSGSVVGQNHPTFQSSFVGITRFNFTGQVFFGPVILAQLGSGSAPEPADPRATSDQDSWGGAVTTKAPWRVFGYTGGVGIDVETCALLIRDGDVVENVAVPGREFRVFGVGNNIVFSNLTGGQPANSIGLDLAGAQSSRFVVLGTNTIGSASGAEVLLVGSVVQRFADFAKTNIIDVNGNEVLGTAGHVASAFILATDAGSDGMAIGEPVKLAGVPGSIEVSPATYETFTEAHCIGVSCTDTIAGADDPVYVAVSGKVYVINTGKTLTPLQPAFVATGPGGIGVVMDGPVPTGKWQQQLGTWIEGTSGVDGYVLFDPELNPGARFDIATGSTGVTVDGPDFLVPVNTHLGPPLVDVGTPGLGTVIEFAWAFTDHASIIQVYLAKRDSGAWFVRTVNKGVPVGIGVLVPVVGP